MGLIRYNKKDRFETRAAVKTLNKMRGKRGGKWEIYTATDNLGYAKRRIARALEASVSFYNRAYLNCLKAGAGALKDL